MRRRVSILSSGKAAALLVLCGICVFASAATRAAPCHEVDTTLARVSAKGINAAVTRAAETPPPSTGAAHGAVMQNIDAGQHPHLFSQRNTTSVSDQAIAEAVGAPIHHSGGTSGDTSVDTTPHGDCCDGGGCALDCGCPAVALIGNAAPTTRPAHADVLTTADLRQPSLSPSELLRPPITA